MFDLVDRSSWAVGVGKNKGDQEVWLAILDEVPSEPALNSHLRMIREFNTITVETREIIEFAVEGSANNEARTLVYWILSSVTPL